MHGDGWARDYSHIPQIIEGQSVQIWVTLHHVGEHKLLLTTCSQEGQHLQFELERILHKYINRLNMQSWCFKIIRVATILCAVVGPTTVARPRIYLRTKSHWGKGAICRGGLVVMVGRSQEASGYQDPQWHQCFLNVLPPKNLLSSFQLYILKGGKLVMDN